MVYAVKGQRTFGDSFTGEICAETIGEARQKMEAMIYLRWWSFDDTKEA